MTQTGIVPYLYGVDKTTRTNMPDILTTITNLIQSPPGQLVAGGVLAGIVWKFFERVESVLNENTKLQIAVWLVGVKPIGPKMGPWPDTFAKVFDRVFGEKHLSWKCFWRSCVASVSVGFICLPFVLGFTPSVIYEMWQMSKTDPKVRSTIVFFACSIPVGSIIPDYLTLLETRIILRIMGDQISRWVFLLVLDLALTFATAIVWTTSVMALIETSHSHQWLWQFQSLFFDAETPLGWIVIPSAVFTSIWLWLYAGSGFLLKAARRFDIGFEWLNRKFDIEKKPLQSVGLVAGAFVAVVYWAAVIVSRVVS
jgi:hypothetical protein